MRRRRGFSGYFSTRRLFLESRLHFAGEFIWYFNLRLELFRKFLGSGSGRWRCLDRRRRGNLRGRLNYWLGSFRRGRNDFDPASATTNNIGPNPSLYDCFPSLDLPDILIAGCDDPVRDYFFLADMDLRLLLPG
jgi:hypothetical protein